MRKSKVKKIVDWFGLTWCDIVQALVICVVAMFVYAAILVLRGEEANGGDVVVTTLFADGQTNTWTQADLIAALQLLNRKYHRDCERPEGRRAWHGKLVGQSVDTNTLTKVERHEDGTVFTFPARIITPADSAKARLERIKGAQKRQATTNGVPLRLALARVKAAQRAATTNTVTVTGTAGR